MLGNKQFDSLKDICFSEADKVSLILLLKQIERKKGELLQVDLKLIETENIMQNGKPRTEYRMEVNTIYTLGKNVEFLDFVKNDDKLVKLTGYHYETAN
ncbi:hypothetical protein CNR22_00210 [Sphingobacteriaceae bacterium]|nr:hypothetical protein CNR22_00210 [Sphingobacteriaceae bacterium]